MTSTIPWFRHIFWILLLAFISTLSVTGTIALRNVLHLVLLLMLLVYGLTNFHTEKVRIVVLTKAVPLPVLLWCGYLLIFPFFASDQVGAFANFLGKGMWGESILTWILAWGAVLILRSSRRELWSLALVSAVPVFIHLTLLVLAWGGVLQPEFYEAPALDTAVSSALTVLANPSSVQGPFSAFPMGFRGIEPMHGNLGYPASQATCLALAVAFSAWNAGERKRLVKAVALIAACFFSVVIAQSRAAAYFALLICLAAFLLYWWTMRGNRSLLLSSSSHQRAALGWKSVLIAIGLVALSMLLFVKVVSTQMVWYSMGDKMALGFRMENPKALLCEGFPNNLPEQVNRIFPGSTPEYVDTLVDGLRGDGARVLLARVGLELVRDFPWGLNGGRDAYQIRMAQACKHFPAMNYSHAHNAWINMALAIGLGGVFLYGALLFGFMVRGLRLIQNPSDWPVGMSLVLLGVFWACRAAVDAVFQEHYLQMQALLLLYLALTTVKPCSNEPCVK